MAELEKGKRKRWTKEETLLFLRCYSARKDEFCHARKKKTAFGNVLEDMIFQGFEDPDVSATTLDAKMRTLLLAYKTAKDNNRQTGASRCVIPYFKEMDEIFGDKPIISNVHTVSLSGKPIQPLVEPSHIRASPNYDKDSQIEPSPTATSTYTASGRIRKTAKDKYRKAKLELKKEKIEVQKKFLDEAKTMLREKWQNQEEIERKKIKLLEMTLNLRND